MFFISKSCLFEWPACLQHTQSSLMITCSVLHDWFLCRKCVCSEYVDVGVLGCCGEAKRVFRKATGAVGWSDGDREPAHWTPAAGYQCKDCGRPPAKPTRTSGPCLTCYALICFNNHANALCSSYQNQNKLYPPNVHTHTQGNCSAYRRSMVLNTQYKPYITKFVGELHCKTSL